MARVTAEDCLDNVENRFELVLASAKRARQLANGIEPKVDWQHDKPTVVALREIAEGHVTSEILTRAEEAAAESLGLGGFSAADVEAEVGGGPVQPDPSASQERSFDEAAGDPGVGAEPEGDDPDPAS